MWRWRWPRSRSAAAGRAREAGYTRLVNPGRPIPAASQAIHGTGDADVRDAPTVAEALVEFLRLCHGRPIVARTAGFDLPLLPGGPGATGGGLAGP